MRLTDLTVEVRDLTLTRLGQVPPHALDFSATVVDSAPGEWHIRLPADHEMADPLRTPGAGIIVTGPDGVIFSGPMTRAEVESTWEDQTGVLVADGVTDEIILWDTLAYPTPDFDWSGLFMPDAYWSDTGLAWEVMGQLVLDQIIDSGRFDGLLGGLLDLDLSAVDGSGSGPEPGVNLVPNPNPTTEDAGWGGAYGPFDDWWCEYDGDNDPVWYTEASSYIDLAYGPASMETPSCFKGVRGRTFPVRRDMTAIPASAGASYQVAADGLVAITAGEPGTFSIGVDWLDSAGDFISTSESTPVVKGVDEGPEWLYGPGDRTWRPEDTFTSPAGTEYAAPFIRMGAGTVDTPDCYAANFFFGVSA